MKLTQVDIDKTISDLKSCDYAICITGTLTSDVDLHATVNCNGKYDDTFVLMLTEIFKRDDLLFALFSDALLKVAHDDFDTFLDDK